MLNNQEINVSIARSPQDLMLALDIRRQVFVEEQGEEPSEQYDGNDLSAVTHFIATIGGKPVGTMRLRFVDANKGGTYLWERWSVLKKYRGTGILPAMYKAAMSYTHMKGCKNVRGIIENPKFARYFEQYGGTSTGEPDLAFVRPDGTIHRYKPMVMEIEASSSQTPTAETIASEPDRFARLTSDPSV